MPQEHIQPEDHESGRDRHGSERDRLESASERHGSRTDDDTLKVIASALSSGDSASPLVAEQRPDLAGLGQVPDLAGLGQVPGRSRRRIEALLGEGEAVECVVGGGRRTGPRYLVATTHRILVVNSTDRLSGEPDSISLPYHRTDPIAVDDREMTLEFTEFGNTRTETIELRDGYHREVSHIIDLLGAG